MYAKETLYPAVFQFDLSYEVNNDLILEDVLTYRKNFPTSRISSIRYAWHSDYYMHRDMPSIVDHLFNTVEEKIRNFMIKGTNYADGQLILVSSWGIIYEQGSSVEKHNHGNSIFSGVYYAQAATETAPLIFSESGIEVKPRTGLCLIFPGYLTHHVPMLENDGPRTAISFNYHCNFKTA